MRQQTMKRILSVGIITCLGIGLLTGCKEKKVDYNIDGVEDTMQTDQDSENSAKSGVEQFSDLAEWNEMWTIRNEEGEQIDVTVEAKISVPETEQMSVVEVAMPEFNAEYKEQLIRKLFDKDAVYYNDFEHYTKMELEELHTYYKELFDSSDDEVTREEIKLRMEECELALENAKDTHTQATEYDVNQYIGQYDGTMFQLEFHTDYDDVSPGHAYSQWANFFAKDVRDICPKEYEGYTHYMGHPFVNSEEYQDIAKNECKLSEQEAEKLARDFIDDLGLDYPVLTSSIPLLWGDNTLSTDNCYEWPAHGYVFQYEYGLDDISFTGFGVDWEYDNLMNYSIEDETQYSMQAQISVFVTEQGVINMYMDSPVETTGMTERVELLPFDTIKDIMKKEMESQYGEFRFMYLSVEEELIYTHMELIYFRVSDKENPGHYSYVPAWRLSEQLGLKELGTRTIRNPVIINAIDGSVIDLYDET